MEGGGNEKERVEVNNGNNKEGLELMGEREITTKEEIMKGREWEGMEMKRREWE